jgi:serine/threonine protein kinase
VAPEVLEKKAVSKAQDMWSVGVVVFMLLGGYPPFFEEDINELYTKIRAIDFEIRPEYWCGVSEEAIAFVRALLVKEASRMTVEQALSHPWLARPAEQLALTKLNNNFAQLATLRKGHQAFVVNFFASSAIEVIKKISSVTLLDSVDVVRNISSSKIGDQVIRKASFHGLGTGGKSAAAIAASYSSKQATQRFNNQQSSSKK